MDDKSNPKSAWSADADPPVDRTSGDPTGQQPQAPEPAVQPPKLLDLSWPQVFGGALAAMTAAVLGSRLGVAGTVVGAALASVCAAVFGSVYTTSIRRTQKMALTALTVAQNQRGRTRPAPRVTTSARNSELATARADGSNAASKDCPPTTSHQTGQPRRARRVLITSIAGGAAVFMVAISAIAGIELASGRTLDGNKGTTTVGEVFRGSGGHRSDGTKAKRNDPGNQPSGAASDGPSAGSSGSPATPNSPGDQRSSAPAPEASGPAGPGTAPSAGQASGGQDSGGSGSGVPGSNGSDQSGSNGSDQSGSTSNSTGSGAGGSGSSNSGSTGSGVSGF